MIASLCPLETFSSFLSPHPDKTNIRINVDIIFSKENLNKIQAVYGNKFVEALKDADYRLIIVSSRPVTPIKEWLTKYDMSKYFDDVTNTKHPAKYYIDDHALRFEKEKDDPWREVLEIILDEEAVKENKNG